MVVDRDLPPELGASAVQSDHATGMREAVDHLLDLGHRRIALVAGSLTIRPGHARLAGMQEAIAARGLPDESIHMPGSFTVEHGESATNQLLDMPEPPTAIIAGGNHPFVGCLTAITQRGLRHRRGHLAGRLRRRSARADLPAPDRVDLAGRRPDRPDRLAAAAQASRRRRRARDGAHPDDLRRAPVRHHAARGERDPVRRGDSRGDRTAQLARGPTASSRPDAALR